MQHQYITLGCSHTNGTYLPQSDHWINMLSKRKGIDFFRISKNAAGLAFLVLYTKQYINQGLDPNAVKYVIIQKPKAYRHPFWGKDKSGYRYIGKNPSNKISVASGMHQAMRKWKKLSLQNKQITSEIIFQEQKNHLHELKEIFPEARFAYYHYWGDYVAELLHRPLLAEVNVQLGFAAAEMGMDNWSTIIDPHDIEGVYDDEDDLAMQGKTIFAKGWIRSRKDYHPMRRHHEIVAEKVENWIFTNSKTPMFYQ